MNAWDWWADARRDAKIAIVCAVVAVVGLVIGLTQIDSSSEPESPPRSPYQVGFDAGWSNLQNGDSRDLAYQTCMGSADSLIPGERETGAFYAGCWWSVRVWKDSDWPGGAPTQGD